MTAWTLEDVEAVHREAPRTFSIPTLARRRELCAGDLVKLVFRLPAPVDGIPGERVWVKIEHAADGRFRGVIDSAPHHLEAAPGDAVEFELRHVAAVWVEPGGRGWVNPLELAIVSQAWLDEESWPIPVREAPLEARDSGWRILPAAGPPGRLLTLTLRALERQLHALDTILDDPRLGGWRWDDASAEFRPAEAPALWPTADGRAALGVRPAPGFDDRRLAIVSRRVFAGGARPCRLVLGARERDDDSGWRLFAGDESRAYLDDAANTRGISLRDLIYAWPDLDAVFGHSEPGDFAWDPAASRYRRQAPGN